MICLWQLQFLNHLCGNQVIGASTINDHLATLTLHLAHGFEQHFSLWGFINLLDLLQQHLPHDQGFSSLWYLIHGLKT
jgi:hypothetical protein